MARDEGDILGFDFATNLPVGGETIDAGTLKWIDVARASNEGDVRVRLAGSSLRGDLTIANGHAVIG